MLYHGNQAEKVFIALFYEQADHQENFYFTECKIILIFAENLVITVILARVGVGKIAARFARLLPYLTTNPAAAYGQVGLNSD